MTTLHRAGLCALVALVAASFQAAPASASPLADKQAQATAARSKIAALDARLQAATDRYSASRSKLAKVNGAVAANARDLDRLLGSVQSLETHLNTRATFMYEAGPGAFINVLMGSKSFQEFSTNWDILANLSAQDATNIANLKVTRSQALVQAAKLLSAQQDAASQLRVLDGARSSIQSQLAQRKALLASTQQDIAAMESASARAVASRASAEVSGGNSNPYAGKSGSGGWYSAMCSWYGPGFYGQKMADGEVLRPDSMIVAHKTMRFGTLVEFSYHGHRAVAKVADRGPYVSGRQFDLGPGTARCLGFDGVDRVQYRIIGG